MILQCSKSFIYVHLKIYFSDIDGTNVCTAVWMPQFILSIFCCRLNFQLCHTTKKILICLRQIKFPSWFCTWCTGSNLAKCYKNTPENTFKSNAFCALFHLITYEHNTYAWKQGFCGLREITWPHLMNVSYLYWL